MSNPAHRQYFDKTDVEFAAERAFQLGMVVGAAIIAWAIAVHKMDQRMKYFCKTCSWGGTHTVVEDRGRRVRCRVCKSSWEISSL